MLSLLLFALAGLAWAEKEPPQCQKQPEALSTDAKAVLMDEKLEVSFIHFKKTWDTTTVEPVKVFPLEHRACLLFCRDMKDCGIAVIGSTLSGKEKKCTVWKNWNDYRIGKTKTPYDITSGKMGADYEFEYYEKFCDNDNVKKAQAARGCDTKLVFTASMNTIMVRHVIAAKTGIATLSACLFECLKNTNCVSFQYFYKDQECNLNNLHAPEKTADMLRAKDVAAATGPGVMDFVEVFCKKADAPTSRRAAAMAARSSRLANTR